MFTSCCFCLASLGTNETIEHFPVGARVAFDGARGRLWAVCPRCARWNLAPIEERWEALEECEVAYRAARQRVSTDNIALARLKDGTELVRIGRPLLPEFAAWRYGRQLRQRERRFALALHGGSALSVVYAATYFVAGSSASASVLLGLSCATTMGHVASSVWMSGHKQPRVALRETDGRLWGISAREMEEARVGLTADARLRVTIRDRPLRAPGPLGRLTRAPYGWDKSSDLQPRTRELIGDDAMDLLRLGMPTAHRNGGSRADVNAAVEHVESQWIGRDEPAEQVVARWLASPANRVETTHDPARGRLYSFIPAPLRLAADMALQDDDERRALAGELGTLYARWEEAERIARIADGGLGALH